jgi:peroxiredoxin
MHMRRILFSLFALVFILVFVPKISFAGMGGGNILPVGVAAPDFQYTDLDGQKSSLYETDKGKPLLLVFIQRTCRSCQREMEFLKELKERNKDLNILGVFIDAVEKNFNGFKKEMGLPFRFFWDANLEVADTYGVSFAPTSFLLDKDRLISKVYRGWSRQDDQLEADYKILSTR